MSDLLDKLCVLAAENERLRNALIDMDQKNLKFRFALTCIAELDPARHSSRGPDEWGKADCFDLAQRYVNTALKGEIV